MIPDNSNRKWMSSLLVLILRMSMNVTQSNSVFFPLCGETKQIRLGVKACLKSSL